MADTDITLAQFRTELGECKTALASSDYATAFKKLALAEISLAGLELEVDDAGTSVKYRAALEGVRKALSAAQAESLKGAGGSRFVSTRVTQGRSNNW